jgi:hypothetical protein
MSVAQSQDLLLEQPWTESLPQVPLPQVPWQLGQLL